MKQEGTHLFAYQKRVHTALVTYTVACIAVCAFTLFMGTRDNVLTTSMSAMGNTSAAMHVAFIVWTIAFCGYFASLAGFILIMTQNTHSRVRGLVYAAVAVMIVGDIMPFVPAEHPVAAFLHDTCAQFASIALALSLMFLALSIMKRYPEIFRKAIIWVLIIWAALLGLMALFGTKAVTEMTGILGGSIYLICFAWWIGGTEDFSASEALSSHDAQQAEEEARKLEKKAGELREEYLKAETEARHARFVADELRRVEARHRRAPG